MPRILQLSAYAKFPLQASQLTYLNSWRTLTSTNKPPTTQAKSINSSLLAPNVQGRVDMTRTFDGQESNAEYLFGLFANLAAQQNNPNAFTLLGVPTGYEIMRYA